MQIQPLHVFITLVSFAIIVLGFMWRITKGLVQISKSLTAFQIKLEMMWKDFAKRKDINFHE